MKLATLLLLTLFAYARCATHCNICKMTVQAMQTWYKTHGPTDAEVFLKALIEECGQMSSSTDIAYCKTFSNCQYRKIHGDVHAASETVERTCIDIGACDGPLSSDPNAPLVDWTGTTTNYQADRCVPVTFLVLHHTVTHSAQETLEILNDRGLSVQYIGGKDGTMYQMVHDYFRAWHAGTSYWREYSDLNSWAVGIEIVNTGDEPFPAAQMDGLIALCRMIINRWHIDQHDIVGHFDIRPPGKNDPSGYFDWKLFYTQLGFYQDVWPSKLTTAEQKAILMKPSSYNSGTLMQLQEDLSRWGYRGNMVVTGNYDTDTKEVIQAFNRHWCPEVFQPEKVDYTTNSTIINPENQQWYGISQERLQHLLLTL